MRNAYISALYDLAGSDDRIMALVSDNGAIVYDKYRRDFADRFINFGISEANMVSVAAGLASCGKVPFAYTIADFLTMRAFEQIRNDVCLQKMNVKLVGIGAGFVYSDLGPTHHTVEDIALMRTLPGMTIIAPADPIEARKATFAAADIEGPVYLRLATGGSPAVYLEDYEFRVGRSTELAGGNDITIISYGHIIPEVIQAVEQLESRQIYPRLINMHTLKPIDRQAILRSAAETGGIITVEEHTVNGGLGSVVAEVLAEERQDIPFRRIGLNDCFPAGYGSYKEMKNYNGLSALHIVGAVSEMMETCCG